MHRFHSHAIEIEHTKTTVPISMFLQGRSPVISYITIHKIEVSNQISSFLEVGHGSIIMLRNLYTALCIYLVRKGEMMQKYKNERMKGADSIIRKINGKKIMVIGAG